jgi:hypothetical protein
MRASGPVHRQSLLFLAADCNGCGRNRHSASKGLLAHDPEKRTPVFGKDQTGSWGVVAIQPKATTL